MSYTGEPVITTVHLSRHYDDEVYTLFSRPRKLLIVSIVAFYGFLSPFSSISILAASPELASSFNTTEIIINVSNAVYMVSMGLSAPFWAPLSQIYGRRLVILLSGAFFFIFSLSNVFVTSLTAYFIIRGLVAFHGTSFLVLGAAVVGDIYEPTARATAISWVLFGGLMGPAFGPLVGGIIITYQPWWVIFALQAGLAGIAFILALLFLPETIHYRRDKELEGLKFKQRISKIWTWTNPARLIDLCSDAGIIIVALASSSIIWNMYALLCPIRYVLNPRYGLSKPLESALFYLAPGSGYLLGAVFGGRWSDYMLKKMIRKREGEFIPEDRLRATYVPLGMIIPGSILVYGWAIKTEVGGIPVPVIAMFVQGVGQFFALPSLNTYCLDVMPSRSAEVIALNYMLRYLFAAVGTAAALPIIESIGVGWLSVISSLFLITTAGLVALTCRYGQIWRKGGVD